MITVALYFGVIKKDDENNMDAPIATIPIINNNFFHLYRNNIKPVEL